MAIIFEGLSKCPLCDKVLDKTKTYLGFPPVTNNKKDALFVFSDSGVHEECVNKHPFADRLHHIMQAYDSSLPVSRVCIVDGQIIKHPDHMIGFGMLTSDEKQPLFKYNFIRLNKENICDWNQREEFLSIAKKFIDDGEWDNYGEIHRLQYLISIINAGC